MLKRFDYRIIIGAVLILGGGLMLLDKLGVLTGAINYFWTVLLAVGALVFLYMFFTDHGKWWAAIPGFALLGMAATAILTAILPDELTWADSIFLGCLGLGFWAVYFRTRERWWAIIPAGVLLTLAATSALPATSELTESGGLFCIGLGLTFLLVALLAKMRWAYIPAAVLFVVGFFLGPTFEGWLEYAWIGILLVGGIILILGALRKD